MKNEDLLNNIGDMVDLINPLNRLSWLLETIEHAIIIVGHMKGVVTHTIMSLFAKVLRNQVAPLQQMLGADLVIDGENGWVNGPLKDALEFFKDGAEVDWNSGSIDPTHTMVAKDCGEHPIHGLAGILATNATFHFLLDRHLFKTGISITTVHPDGISQPSPEECPAPREYVWKEIANTLFQHPSMHSDLYRGWVYNMSNMSNVANHYCTIHSGERASRAMYLHRKLNPKDNSEGPIDLGYSLAWSTQQLIREYIATGTPFDHSLDQRKQVLQRLGRKRFSSVTIPAVLTDASILDYDEIKDEVHEIFEGTNSTDAAAQNYSSYFAGVLHLSLIHI